jgi:hypothetical protein
MRCARQGGGGGSNPEEGIDEQEEGGGRHDDDNTPITPLGGNADHNDNSQRRDWRPHDEQSQAIEQSQLALLFSLVLKLHCMYLGTHPRKASPPSGKYIYFTRIFCVMMCEMKL